MEKVIWWPNSSIHSEQHKKYQIEKWQAMVVYIDTGSKYSLPSTTDWLTKWTDVYKKQTCRKIWPKKRPPCLHTKKRKKKNRSHNCRPITCLLMKWKIKKARSWEEIYNLLKSCGPFGILLVPNSWVDTWYTYIYPYIYIYAEKINGLKVYMVMSYLLSVTFLSNSI